MCRPGKEEGEKGRSKKERGEREGERERGEGWGRGERGREEGERERKKGKSVSKIPL